MYFRVYCLPFREVHHYYESRIPVLLGRTPYLLGVPLVPPFSPIVSVPLLSVDSTREVPTHLLVVDPETCFVTVHPSCGPLSVGSVFSVSKKITEIVDDRVWERGVIIFR